MTGVALLDGAPTHAGILVSIAGPVTAAARTNEDGRYVVDALPDGDYVVLASALSTREGTRVQLATVREGSGTVDDLHFTALGIVVGSVTAAPAPVSGAAVTVAGTDSIALTDAQGRYRLANVPVGRHTVLASLGTLRASAEVQAIYATEIEAPELQLAPAVPITGAIVGTAHLLGAPTHQGIVITAIGPASAATQTDAAGNYALPSLPDGHYAVTLTAASTAEHTIVVDTDIVGGTTAYLSDIMFHPFGAVSGKAVLAGATNGNAGIAVFASGGTSIAFTGDDGSYTLDGVAPGARVLTATHAGFQQAQSPPLSVTYAATTNAPDLDLAPGQSPANERLAGVAKLVGMSTHGGTTVAVRETGATTTTAADGSYRIDGLEPGIYTLTFDNGEYHERVPNVLAISGGSGYVVNGGAFVGLDVIEVPRGRRIFDGKTAFSFKTSANGAHVLIGDNYSTSSWRLWDVPVDGTGTTLLSQFGDPYNVAFAPDGSSLLYLGGPSTPFGLRLSNASGDRQLLPAPANLLAAPDGSRVATFSNGMLSVIDQTGGQMMVGPAMAYQAVFSVDGTQLAYLDTNGNPRVYSFSTGTSAAPPGFSTRGPFSIDGVHVFCRTTASYYFSLSRVADPPDGNSSCYDGYTTWFLPSGGAYVAGFSSPNLTVTPSGSSTPFTDSNVSQFPLPIATRDHMLYSKGPTLLSMRVADGSIATLSTMLTGDPSMPPPVVSRDGSRVLYLATSSEPYKLLLSSSPVDGGSMVSLGTCNYGYYSGPRYWFTADGTRAVYESGSSLVSQPLSGGAPTTLVANITYLTYGFHSGVSPNGERAWALASGQVPYGNGYLAVSDGALTTADPATGNATTLLHYVSTNSGPMWLDGRTMVVARSGSPYSFEDGLYVVTVP